MLKTKERKKASAEANEKKAKKALKKATEEKAEPVAEKKKVKKAKKAPSEKKPNFFVDMIKGFVTSSASNTEKAASKKRFPLLAIGTSAIVTALFMVIIASFMQISQIQADMKLTEASIRELRAEERKLSMELEGRYSSKIESVAADMGLSGKYHPTYYLESESSTEEIVEKTSEETKVDNSLLNAISRSFKKFIEFID